MTSIDISKRVSELYQRVQDLRTQSLRNPDSAIDVLSDALVELESSIEELSTAEEALRESEGRQAFLLALGDRIREIQDTRELMAVASEMVGRYLSANGVVYCEIDEAGECATVRADWNDGTVPSAAGKFRMDDFGIGDLYRQGLVRRTSDVTIDFDGDDVSQHCALRIRASLGVPIFQGGRLVAVLAAHSARPRDWTDADVETLRQAGDRMWSAINRANVEEARRESEKMYRTMIETAGEGIIFSKPEGTYLYSNQRFADMLGYSLDEISGKSSNDFSFADEQPHVQQICRTLNKGDVISGEFRFRRKDGSELWTLFNATPVFNVAGEHIANFAMHTDITERKKIEEALWESEARFRNMAELSPAMVVIDRIPDGTLLFTNSAFDTAFGFREGELIDRKAPELYANPKDRQELIRKVQINGSIEGHEVQAKKKDGTLFWISASTRFINFGSEQVLLSAFIDITERKWAEEALRKSKDELEQRVQERTKELQRANEVLREGAERFRRTFDQSPIGATIVSLDYRFLRANSAYCCIVGYSEEELLKLTFVDITHPDDLEANLEQTRRIARGEIDRYQMDKRLIRKDGRIVWIRLSVGTVKDASGISLYYLSMIEDITERKKAEEALRAAKEAAEAAVRAKATFMANMSHELRTPLNAIIGMTGLLLDEELPDEHKDFLEIIRNSGDSLLSLINDVLYFSKMEAERSELEDQPFDLRACVEDALDLVALAAAKKDLNLAYMMDKDVPETIVADPGKLRQILGNLLSNAVKFTDKGEVTVSAKYSPAGVRDDICFTVADTGIGIPDESLAELFQPFYQVESSSKRRYGGTGLGLSISKNLVEKMGGRIWVESQPDIGSTFSFTIKVRVSPGTESFLFGLKPDLAGKRLLIVDDCRTNRRILGQLAREWGMIPAIAISGRSVVEMISRGDAFDCAIIGSKLPDMDAAALVRVIRRNIGDIPLIVLSHVGQNKPKEVQAGITKPIKPVQLYNVLTGFFEHQPEEGAPASLEEDLIHKDMRILLAEDEPSNQKVTMQMLRKLGYRADCVANGREALEALERQPYDVVLMDVRMPEMDGFEATREIRRLWPEGPTIIAITAYAMQGDREKCLEASMDDYLGKPVKRAELAKILDKYHNRQKSGQEG